MLRNFKVLLAVLMILVISGSAFAFAAQNTWTDPYDLGYIADLVTGYAITNFHVVLVPGTAVPAAVQVDEITFNVAPIAPGSVKAGFVALQSKGPGTAWDTSDTICVLADDTPPRVKVTCTFGADDLPETARISQNIIATDGDGTNLDLP